MYQRLLSFFLLSTLYLGLSASKLLTIDVSEYGIQPHAKHNMSALQQLLTQHKKVLQGDEKVRIIFPSGEYIFDFYQASSRTFYVTNHDQSTTKKIAFDLSKMKNVTIDGNGSTFIFKGIGIPIVIENSKATHLKDFCINYADPQITEITILEKSDAGTKFCITDPNKWGIKHYSLTPNGRLQISGHGWTNTPGGGIAFEKETHHIVYNTGDIGANLNNCTIIGADSIFLAPHWNDKRLKEGTIVALRDWERPTPGICLAESKDTKINNVCVNYAYGMALVAQSCHNITLKDFKVIPEKGKVSSTQADATHFCQCSGHISSTHGVYTGMMDDAINIHGVYLRMVKRIDAYTAVFQFMHSQAWGYKWGTIGDSVRFIRSDIMENNPQGNSIIAITPIDGKDNRGMKQFKIAFKTPIPQKVDGVENFTRTPTVHFAHNYISNNRARGALFSSPRKTLCENNTFDHTSGSAILVAGDCNGWYESGPVEDIVIRKNTFLNALTSKYQFTNAIISIYPEVPLLDKQLVPYHRNIIIEKNNFNMFEGPIVYAKSVEGLIIKHNKILINNDYPQLWKNKPHYWIDKNVKKLSIIK